MCTSMVKTQSAAAKRAAINALKDFKEHIYKERRSHRTDLNILSAKLKIF